MCHKPLLLYADFIAATELLLCPDIVIGNLDQNSMGYTRAADLDKKEKFLKVGGTQAMQVLGTLLKATSVQNYLL